MKGLMMDYPLTIDRILEHANRLYPDKNIYTKLPDGSMHRYTYAHLFKRAKRLGNVLERMGVARGDRVGTFSWNNYQHLELYFGIPCAGAVCHTINIRLFPDQLAYVINHAEDRVIFADGTLLPLLEQVAERIEGVSHFVLFNVDKGVETSLKNVLHYEELMADVDEEFDWKVSDESEAMGLCYTSGTTGDPKGVLYSHRSMYLHTIGECQANALGLTENDVLLAVVPQFHAMAWGLPYACANVGADLILPGPHLNPHAVAELIVGHEVTVAAGVPTIWTGLFRAEIESPRRFQHSSAGGGRSGHAPSPDRSFREGAFGQRAPRLGDDGDVPAGDGVDSETPTPEASRERAVGRQGQAGVSRGRRRAQARERKRRRAPLGWRHHGRAADPGSLGRERVFQARRDSRALHQ
jgi:fatty-acyl-CoA synthase